MLNINFWLWLHLVNVLDLVIRLTLRHNTTLKGLAHLNPGCAYGLGRNWPNRQLLVVHMVIIMLLAVVDPVIATLSWPNLLERVVYGNVTDYLYLPVIGVYINLNDVTITLSSVLTIVYRVLL